MQRRQSFVHNMNKTKKEKLDMLEEMKSNRKNKEEEDRAKFNRRRYQ